MAVRDDTARLLAGQGRYSADITQPDMAHAVFVRADRPHARIVSIDVESAQTMDGVIAVLTGADAADLKAFPAVLRYPDKEGATFVPPHRPVIAADRVRHMGEIVAVVVAETAAAAQDAAEAVAIDYEDLPPVIGLDAGLADDLPALHEGRANLAYHGRFGDAGAVDAAFARARHTVALTVDLPRVVPNAMEPRSAVATFDAQTGTFDLWAPHQGIAEVRNDLAKVFDIAPASIRVHPIDVGGGFGARGPAYPEYAALMLAARKAGRPVRWLGTRSEGFLTEHHGRGNRLSGSLALDAEGRFLALRVAYLADLGAYVTPVGAHVNVHNPLQTITGTYIVPAVEAEFRLVFTNATPTGPYRGAGRPDIALLIERLVDEAARVSGIDRVALRRINRIPSAAFPHRNPFGATYDSGDYDAMLDLALQRAEWEGFAARRTESAAHGRLRGIGLSLFTEVAGGGPSPTDEVELSLVVDADGLAADLATVSGATGQPHAVTFATVLAEQLGVPDLHVRFDPSAASTTLAGSGSFGSRTTTAVSAALVAACREIGARAVARAAAQQGLDPATLHFAQGHVRNEAGTSVATLIDLVREANDAAAFRVRAGAASAVTFPSGCHVAEVEIDPDTGVVRLLRYVAVDDAGRVLNHAAVEGQVIGGVAQGLGEAFGEVASYDADGQLLSGSFMDYFMPRADDLPMLDVVDCGVPSPTNPLGAKGAGEAGTTGALGAISNAVTDALNQAGAGPLDMPFTPERVWQALRRR